MPSNVDYDELADKLIKIVNQVNGVLASRMSQATTDQEKSEEAYLQMISMRVQAILFEKVAHSVDQHTLEGIETVAQAIASKIKLNTGDDNVTEDSGSSTLTN